MDKPAQRQYVPQCHTYDPEVKQTLATFWPFEWEVMGLPLPTKRGALHKARG